MVPDPPTFIGRSLPKIATIENGPISRLHPFASLLLLSNIVIVLLVCNILERWLLRMVYGTIYVDLERPGNERRRRSFTYYHVGAIVMLIIFCSGIYPVMNFLVGPGSLVTPITRDSDVRTGDVLLILSQTYSAYYIFELCYRTQFASPINIAHHVGLLAIIQTAISLFGNFVDHPEATIEFYMCIMWGIFDVCVELPIFVAMICWRIIENPWFRSRIAYGCYIWLLLGATVETSVTIYLLHQSWDRWRYGWKVVTPLLFSLWISAQLFASTKLIQMARSQSRKGKSEPPSVC